MVYPLLLGRAYQRTKGAAPRLSETQRTKGAAPGLSETQQTKGAALRLSARVPRPGCAACSRDEGRWVCL